MEVDYTEGISENELKMYRNFMNSKIDIFQSNDEYVFRNDKVTENFYESYEHRQMQNNAAKMLSSASNLLLYSIAHENENLEISNTQLKKIFTKNEVEEKENNLQYIEKKHNEFKKSVMRKKLKENAEYIKICEFIENPRFHEFMVTNRALLKYILQHKYVIYHPQYEELIEKYNKYLCPMFQASSNSLANTNSENEEEDDNMDDSEN